MTTAWVLGAIATILLTFALWGCAGNTVYVNGVPNLIMVTPGVWRSGQPETAAQWQTLHDMGVRHVVKLNFMHEGVENGDQPAVDLGMDVHLLSIQPEGDTDIFDEIENVFVKPDAALIREALRTMHGRDGVLVHCTHGQDRTGLVVGMFRVLELQMSKDDAYAEMLARGFHPELHGVHEFWESFDRSTW